MSRPKVEDKRLPVRAGFNDAERQRLEKVANGLPLGRVVRELALAQLDTQEAKVPNYANRVLGLLDARLSMQGTPYEGLLPVYALLVLTVGQGCTNEHVHDAWSLWQDQVDPDHRSLVPFDNLSADVQNLDTPYRDAIIRVARELRR